MKREKLYKNYIFCESVTIYFYLLFYEHFSLSFHLCHCERTIVSAAIQSSFLIITKPNLLDCHAVARNDNVFFKFHCLTRPQHGSSPRMTKKHGRCPCFYFLIQRDYCCAGCVPSLCATSQSPASYERSTNSH